MSRILFLSGVLECPHSLSDCRRQALAPRRATGYSTGFSVANVPCWNTSTLIRMSRTLIRMIITLIQAIRSLIRITRKLSLPQWRAEQRAAGRRPFEGDLRGRPVELHRHFIAYRAPPHAVRATHSHAQPSMQHGDEQHATGQELVMPSEQRNTCKCCLPHCGLRWLASHQLLMQLSRAKEPASSGSGACHGMRYGALEAHSHARVHACTDACTHTHQHAPTHAPIHTPTRTHAHPCIPAAAGGHTWWHTPRAQWPMTTDGGRK